MKPEEFKQLLKKADLKQNAFAEKIGVCKFAVNNWCSGRVPVNSIAVAYLKLYIKVKAVQKDYFNED